MQDDLIERLRDAGYVLVSPGMRKLTHAAAARIAALEADNARLLGLVKDVEQSLAMIYAGDEGPVLLNNSVKALCARRHEVGFLLRHVIRTLAKIKEATDA